MAHLEKGSKKLLNAWAFYDWANSVYSLVIASAVFPIFYDQLFPKGTMVNAFGTSMKSTALMSFTTAFAFLIVAFISPLLSGIADYAGNKKNFLKAFCYLGSLSCIGLYWFDVENLYFSLVCYLFGLIGFWGSLVFYNSYLPDVAYPEQQDAVSAKGYSMGYIGSVVLLVINLAMVMMPDLFHLDGAMQAMRISFISVGVWWILFSQYTYYFLPKGNRSNKVSSDVVLNGFRELRKIWQQLKQNVVLKRYLGAFFVYSMAVQTVMLVATYFGAEEIAWADADAKSMGLIVSILLIQLVAVGGALLTSRLSTAIGNIKALIIINSIWAVICVCAFFVTQPIHFYVTAGFVGLVMGGIQSLSRSTYSKFLPETQDTASYFSFYDVTEKIGIVIGMVLYGAIDQYFGSMRYSVIFLTLFFVVGIFLLARVPKKE
ncbi:MFS transporter permease [Flavobacterium akiainvivens]|uniref:MFS transporter permease n=1 Tax=Flavobacterium akiainvivens TaxID=1202724 RepID=A0A0M9VJX9_9FLAO|nr:MFS transporter [Flavobacterium akiainvivens]KOS07959.1 MFS transporter permease [Flavobacterium akiainvivens]SFQ61195.1 MFS transporter, UMF1 family [Flavobacterium akiainvivens]